jgi:hypothetical protein
MIASSLRLSTNLYLFHQSGFAYLWYGEWPAMIRLSPFLQLQFHRNGWPVLVTKCVIKERLEFEQQ